MNATANLHANTNRGPTRMSAKPQSRVYSYIVYEGKMFRGGDLTIEIPPNATFDVITSDKPDLMLAEALAILDRRQHQ